MSALVPEHLRQRRHAIRPEALDDKNLSRIDSDRAELAGVVDPDYSGHCECVLVSKVSQDAQTYVSRLAKAGRFAMRFHQAWISAKSPSRLCPSATLTK